MRIGAILTGKYMLTHFLRRSLRLLALMTAVLAGTAQANVSLRVEGRPPTDPIEVFVNVSDAGAPVTGLAAADFSVKIDGVLVPLQPSNLTQPQLVDPNQHVSVVLVMDYTSSVTATDLDAMQTAVIDFVNAMQIGDMAAIVKFNDSTGASVVATFTEIDLGSNNQDLEDAVLAPYPGDGSNILDATLVGLAEFAGATLPAGPKAVILITDGIDTHSTNSDADVIAAANVDSIPIFTIGIGNPNQNALDLLGSLADDTGGNFFPTATEQDIGDAYASVSALLNSEYLITIANSISDCAEHEIEVTVTGEAPVSALFTRRTCNTTPDAFTFTAQTGVREGSTVVSNPATISGLEVPAHISIIQGAYSIGCTGDFTQQPGTIDNGETVCVRHQASAQPSTSKTSTLTVGGFAATFTTTTRAADGGGGGGGGGTTGLFELLLGLSALFMRRRFTA